MVGTERLRSYVSVDVYVYRVFDIMLKYKTGNNFTGALYGS